MLQAWSLSCGSICVTRVLRFGCSCQHDAMLKQYGHVAWERMVLPVSSVSLRCSLPLNQSHPVLFSQDV